MQADVVSSPARAHSRRATRRWRHGTMMGIGFAPLALPTARTALGAPMARACCAYDMVEPWGILRMVLQARFWNAVPSMCKGTENLVRVPAKYSRNCRTATSAWRCARTSFDASTVALVARDACDCFDVVALATRSMATTPRSQAVTLSTPTGVRNDRWTSYRITSAIVVAGVGRIGSPSADCAAR